MTPSVRSLAATTILAFAVSIAGCEKASSPVGAPILAATSAPLAAGPVRAPAFTTPEWQRAPGPPLALTASDGSGLRLTRLSARAVVAEPLAYTELHAIFENPRDRVIEGTFSITLPPHASIARFAMRTANEWQEGEVVERQAARRAYEDFLHRKQDPALLEQAVGNQFSARVFPIAARGEKELIVSYSEELADGAPYALALKGLPEVAVLDVSVSGDRVEGQTYRQANIVPPGDLVFDRRAAAPWEGVRSGGMVALRVQPLGARSAAPDPLDGVLVLVDTSGSRALGFPDQVRLVREIVGRLAERDPSAALSVACYDQTVAGVFDGQAGAFGDRELQAIETRAALGASDLEGALAWVRAHAAERASVHRVLLVTDGVATAGATEAMPLRAKAAALREVGVERLDVVAVGGIRDTGALKALVTAGLARDGIVVDGGAGAETIVGRLGSQTRSGIAVRVPGASFSYPTTLDGVQPGDEAVIYADVGDAPEVTVSIDGAAPYAVRVGVADAPLLDRAIAGAHVARLLERETAEGKSPELEKEIVDRAVSHRIVTPYTALLVLETDADFARYDIARRGLAEILTVDSGRLVATSRAPWVTPKFPPVQAAPGIIARPTQNVASSDPPHGLAAGARAETGTGAAAMSSPPPAESPPPEPAVPAPAAQERAAARSAPLGTDLDGQEALGLSSAGGGGEAIGIGSVGTVGHGAGFGAGHGRLGGVHQTGVSSLREGSVTVSGRLPPEVIQRIVRQSFGRFRFCYDNGLRGHPNLAGRVAVRFVIDRRGDVADAADAGSDLPDTDVVRCVTRGFSNLSFPAPEGGNVTVVYPILFAPGEPRAEAPGGPVAGDAPSKPADADPYTGKLRDVMDLLARKDVRGARSVAEAWHNEDPGDIPALVALGEVLEASQDLERAARAYGSLIDLYPARADLRRFAGSRLERVKGGDPLALDSYEKAEAERPDHPSSHRLLAYALLKSGAPEKAFDAAIDGLKRRYPEARFPGVHRILQEDVGLIGAAWAKADPARKDGIMARVKEAGGTVEDAPSIRFVLTWETDANDVDFHIHDARGGHAYYQHKHLDSGGDLYADVTTGYGPECFTIRGPKAARSSVYTLQAHYYSRGPMGYGMGKLEVIEHDGNGGLTFDERPYVVMVDRAFVDLGVVKR